jgi:uncharacterized protein YjbJ (UPF0337 family)
LNSAKELGENLKVVASEAGEKAMYAVGDAMDLASGTIDAGVDSAKEFGENLKVAAGEAGEKAMYAVGDAMDRASGAVDAAVGSAKEFGENLKVAAGEAGEKAMYAVGDAMDRASGAVDAAKEYMKGPPAEAAEAQKPELNAGLDKKWEQVLRDRGETDVKAGMEKFDSVDKMNKDFAVNKQDITTPAPKPNMTP